MVHIGKEKALNNRWIVPHNPDLPKGTNCTSMWSVKYLFKYVYKGHDCANVEITEKDKETHDEIKHDLDAMYVSSPEGMWHPCGLKMYDHSHTIICLPVQRIGWQQVYFQDSEHEAVLQRAAADDTMFTAFFKYNQIHVMEFTYNEFPIHFVWNQKQKAWQPRKRGQHISHMYAVIPNDRVMC